MMLCDKIEKADLGSFVLVAGDNWIAEEKEDGDRIRLVFKGGKVTLISRGKSGDVTRRYPEFHKFSSQDEFVLDGEMCVTDDTGVSQFNEGITFRSHLEDQAKISAAVNLYPVTYRVFDILELNGENLRDQPLEARKNILASLNLVHPNLEVVKFTKDIIGKWEEVTSKGGEGIILKRLDSPYFEGKRSSAWKKVKDIKEADVWFTKLQSNPRGIRLENDEGIAVQVSGYHAPPVQSILEREGKVHVTIRHLGWTGKKFRQPTFAKVVVDD